MPRPLTDIRVASSYIGHGTAGTVETAELDFDIGLKEAIEVVAVYGHIRTSTVPSSTTGINEVQQQSLHVEDGTVTAPLINPASADQFEIDSEVIFHQVSQTRSTIDDTAGNAMGTGFITPVGLITFPTPVLSVVNLTHRTECDANNVAGCHLHIHYRYVQLSTDEIAFQYARRRR